MYMDIAAALGPDRAKAIAGAVSRAPTMKKRYDFEEDGHVLVVHPQGYLHHSATLPGVVLELLAADRPHGWTSDEAVDVIAPHKLDGPEQAVMQAIAGVHVKPGNRSVLFNNAVRFASKRLDDLFVAGAGDDGTHYAMHPATTGPLKKNRARLKRWTPQRKTAALALTAAYDSRLAADVFTGEGLKYSAADWVHCLLRGPDRELTDATLVMLATYCGW